MREVLCLYCSRIALGRGTRHRPPEQCIAASVLQYYCNCYPPFAFAHALDVIITDYFSSRAVCSMLAAADSMGGKADFSSFSRVMEPVDQLRLSMVLESQQKGTSRRTVDVT